MPSSIAIIGAGISGLAAAHKLQDIGHNVTLYEKSRHVGGRTATHTTGGFIYDHGAQYVKQGTPASMSLITERFSTPDLIDIQKPVWTFDRHNQIQPGDPQQNAEYKWSYRYGLSSLTKRMAEGLNILLETQIITIQQQTDGWQLTDKLGQKYGPFKQLLITLPAQQARELLEQSSFDSTIQSKSIQLLKQAYHNPLLSIMLGYQPQPEIRPYYALINSDKGHDISWLAWEHEKAPERVPAQTGLLIAQMAPDYSQKHWDSSDNVLIADATFQIKTLLQEDLGDLIFFEVKHWRYALPSIKADAQAINQRTLPTGLAFCGDSYVGGRIYLALEHGISVAEELSSRSL